VTFLLELKRSVKAQPALKRLVLAAGRVVRPLVGGFHPLTALRYPGFLRDWLRFRRAGGRAALLDLYPCLFDRTASTAFDPHYFHQAIWAFRHINESRVISHLDVASDVKFVGLLSTVTEVIFVDYRPLLVRLPNYASVRGSITSLPFANGSVRSLSCLHVIEHVGLARYGDAIDPLGPEKACREIARVLRPGGSAYVSVPIGRPRVHFNGQRTFAAEEAAGLFASLDLVEMAMIDAHGNFFPCVAPDQAEINETGAGNDFGLGLFWFRKRERTT
jgi:hypothetical protein